jgi:hypothetical protein
MLQTKVEEEIKTRTLSSVTFSKIVHFLDNLEKYCTAGQTTDDNMAHAHYMLDN